MKCCFQLMKGLRHYTCDEPAISDVRRVWKQIFVKHPAGGIGLTAPLSTAFHDPPYLP